MRLKYLFFPISIVIAISIFSGYAWPEISRIRDINKEIGGNKAKLSSIIEKRDAVDALDSKMSDEKSIGQFVKNYLPEKRVEERIISSLNLLSTDSGVTLVSLNLKNVDPTGVQKKEQTTAEIISAANSVKNSLEVPGDSRSAKSSSGGSGMKYTEAGIIVSGEYAKIKLFLGQIERMQIFNNIRSVTISKPESAPGAPPSSLLLGNIVVNFGHLEPVKISSENILNFKPDLETDSFLVLKKFVSEKSTAVAGDSQAQGKADPFQQ